MHTGSAVSRERTLELRQWCISNQECLIWLDKGQKLIVIKRTVAKRDPTVLPYDQCIPDQLTQWHVPSSLPQPLFFTMLTVAHALQVEKQFPQTTMTYSTVSFAMSNWVTSDLSAGSCHTVLVQLFAMNPHCLMPHWPTGDQNFAEIWNQIPSQY